VSLDLPVGSITTYGGSSAPTGWLICDGTLVSRTTFAELFSVIGTSYGVGDGSTTFGTPDFRGKIPVGKTTGGTFPALGATGGAETHTLTTAQMPVHSHPHAVDNVSGTLGNVAVQGSAAGASWLEAARVDEQIGSGSAHNILQPYQVVHYIIRSSRVPTSASAFAVPGRELGYSQRTTNQVGAGDVVSVTVISDDAGATPTTVMVEGWAIGCNTTAAAGTTLDLSIWDGAAATGTKYTETQVHNAGASYVSFLSPRGRVAFTGTKTFYMNLQNGAGTPSCFGAATFPSFIRVTRV